MHINNIINACPFAFSCIRKYREIIMSIQKIYFEFSVTIWGTRFGVPWTQKGGFCKLFLRPFASKPLDIVFKQIHTKLGQLEKLFWNRLRRNPSVFWAKVHPKVSYELMTKDSLNFFFNSLRGPLLFGIQLIPQKSALCMCLYQKYQYSD